MSFMPKESECRERICDSHMRNYREMTVSLLGGACHQCYSVEDLDIHHINKNKNDNDKKNLKLLCKPCHRRLHSQSDIHGKIRTIILRVSQEEYNKISQYKKFGENWEKYILGIIMLVETEIHHE